MSDKKYYANSNIDSSLNLFNKRRIYKLNTFRDASLKGANHVRDLMYGETIYIGKVDNHTSPIFLKDEDDLLQSVNSYSPRHPQKALNFVSVLFNEMSRQFDLRAASGQISNNEKYLTSPRVYKSYSSAEIQYQNYVKIFSKSFLKLFRKKQITVTDFDDFMDHFMNLAPQIISKMPLTMSGFVKSDSCTLFSSGLVVEIADLPYDDDNQKREFFTNNKNWDFFLNACNEYGFVVDYNIPWRLVCDIKAPRCEEFMGQFGFISGDFLLDQAYRRASVTSVGSLAKILLDIYNTVRKRAYHEVTTAPSGTICRELRRSADYTITSLYEKCGIWYFPKIYLLLRMMEEQPDLNRKQKKILVSDIMHLVKETNSYIPIEYLFERKINKVVDKKYSVNYSIYVQEPARLMKRFSEKQIKAYSVVY